MRFDYSLLIADLMRALLRQVVIVGGPGTRSSAYGLYELMHAIGDSFSGAHSALTGLPWTGHAARPTRMSRIETDKRILPHLPLSTEERGECFTCHTQRLWV